MICELCKTDERVSTHLCAVCLESIGRLIRIKDDLIHRTLITLPLFSSMTNAAPAVELALPETLPGWFTID